MSDDENKLIAERRAKLDRLRTSSHGGVAFPNDFSRDALADQLLTAYGDRPPVRRPTMEDSWVRS